MAKVKTTNVAVPDELVYKVKRFVKQLTKPPLKRPVRPLNLNVDYDDASKHLRTLVKSLRPLKEWVKTLEDYMQQNLNHADLEWAQHELDVITCWFGLLEKTLDHCWAN